MTRAPILLSIGLNVGAAEPHSQLTDTLNAVASRAAVLEFAMGRNLWEGVPERFLQILVEARHGAEALAALLAKELQQDAVAVLRPSGTHWALVGHDGLTVGGGSVADFPILSRITYTARPLGVSDGIIKEAA